MSPARVLILMMGTMMMIQASGQDSSTAAPTGTTSALATSSGTGTQSSSQAASTAAPTGTTSALATSSGTGTQASSQAASTAAPTGTTSALATSNGTGTQASSQAASTATPTGTTSVVTFALNTSNGTETSTSPLAANGTTLVVTTTSSKKVATTGDKTLMDKFMDSNLSSACAAAMAPAVKNCEQYMEALGTSSFSLQNMCTDQCPSLAQTAYGSCNTQKSDVDASRMLAEVNLLCSSCGPAMLFIKANCDDMNVCNGACLNYTCSLQSCSAVAGFSSLDVPKCSTCPTTTPTSNQATQVTGKISLAVTNVTAFLADPTAPTKVASGIAKAAGVPSTYVTVILSAGRRLALARRLAGGVNVEYTITIPASAPAYVPSATSITNTLATTSTLATSIGSAVGQTVQVTVLTAASSQTVAITTTAAASGSSPKSAAASDAQSYNVGAVLLALSLNFVAMSSM